MRYASWRLFNFVELWLFRRGSPAASVRDLLHVRGVAGSSLRGLDCWHKISVERTQLLRIATVVGLVGDRYCRESELGGAEIWICACHIQTVSRDHAWCFGGSKIKM